LDSRSQRFRLERVFGEQFTVFWHLSDIAQRERGRKEIVITGASGIEPQVKGEIEEGQS
jgi:hypothetical protein